MNQNEDFIKEIFHYFINDLSKYSTNNVIKRHSEKLTEYGDYSFPINTQNWAQFLPSLQHISFDNIFSYREFHTGSKFQSIAEQIEDLVRSSQKWTLQIKSATIKENRCSLYLSRSSVFYSILNCVLHDPNYGSLAGNQSYKIIRNDKIPEEKELLTRYRCRVIESVIENLTKYLSEPEDSSCVLYVTHKSTDTNVPPGSTQIFVGNVTSRDNKVLNVEAEEYIK